jgi:hypothetical protein
MRVYSTGFVHLYDITNWQTLEEVRRYIGNSVLTLEFLPDNPAVHFLQRNGFLVREGTPYIIKHIIQDTELVTVTAHGCHVMLEQRITGGGATKNERLTKTGSADTVVKHFITQSKGDLPLVCAASRGGASISDQTRLKPLGDEVARILSGAGLGEKFTLDATAKKIVFDTYAGVDRTRGNAGDNPPVVFDLDFGNIADPRYIEDATQEQSTIYVGGAGEEDEREIVIVGDDATGLDRVERFRDARDVVAGDTDTLTERGEQELVGTQAAVDVEALAGTGLVYGTDYELGDIVTCRVPRKNYTVDGEYFNPVDGIVEVNQRITEVVITQEEDREHVDLRFGDTPVAPTTLQSLQREVAQLKAADIGDLADYLPLAGGSLTGDLDINGNAVWHAGNLHNSSALCDLYLYGSSTAGNPQYSVQYSEYTRVGDQVDVSFRFVLTSLGGMGGNVRIGNLPFEADASATASATALLVSNITRTNLRAVMALVIAGSTYAQLRIMYESSGTIGEGALAVSHIADDSMIMGIISYKAA